MVTGTRRASGLKADLILQAVKKKKERKKKDNKASILPSW